MKKSLVFITLLMHGCHAGNEAPTAQFKHNVAMLLGDADLVAITASELTEFSWHKLCIKRDERLILTFSTKKSEILIGFDYKDYFVDEAYVKGSLDGKCVSPEDRIFIKRKYSAHSETTELRALQDKEAY